MQFFILFSETLIISQTKSMSVKLASYSYSFVASSNAVGTLSFLHLLSDLLAKVTKRCAITISCVTIRNI